MKPKATIQWTLAFLLLASCMQAQSIWNTAHLANVKHSIHEPFYATTYEILKAEADRLLDAQPLSVMMKEKTPASGDKHDYMSQARYYWPDPTKPNGLPYINRDGVSNPELNKLDRNRLGTTAGRIRLFIFIVLQFSVRERIQMYKHLLLVGTNIADIFEISKCEARIPFRRSGICAGFFILLSAEEK